MKDFFVFVRFESANVTYERPSSPFANLKYSLRESQFSCLPPKLKCWDTKYQVVFDKPTLFPQHFFFPGKCICCFWKGKGFPLQYVVRLCDRHIMTLKALASEHTLLRTHCCRHKCFPVCPRAQHLLRTQILCRDTKNVSDFVQKLFVSAINVSQFAQPKKHHGQQCVLVCQGLKVLWLVVAAVFCLYLGVEISIQEISVFSCR